MGHQVTEMEEQELEEAMEEEEVEEAMGNDAQIHFFVLFQLIKNMQKRYK